MEAKALKFGKLTDVRAGDQSSWLEKIFLSFDIDWAEDSVISETVEIVERAGVPATWFITHDTPVLDRLRENPLFELGIHPNFNFLLNGDHSAGATSGEVVDRLLAFVPGAKAVRAHSLVQGGRLLEMYSKKGITHECSVFVPGASQAALNPWIDWFGITRVPHIWQDDFWCAHGGTGLGEGTYQKSALKVFDFHPIHVYLNTERLERYEEARPYFRAPERLQMQRFDGYGVRSVLSEILN